ncbi:CTP synthase [Dissostichus eleginoides]|uniref:CTP synthase n=1 Tax=Dissostichus eleginoides TaxID=100907 RepID=A0AAD9CK73_DISEL|nr:CTP synthase [Dissostichus eleginoides]
MDSNHAPEIITVALPRVRYFRKADNVEVPDSVEALLFLHCVEDEQVHQDGEEGKKPQADSQQGIMKEAMEGQGVIAPQILCIEEATPAAVAVIDIS